MKQLTLLRHAKSAWDDPVTRDIDRPLNARGRRAAIAVGQAMRAAALRFDVVVASPARRVMETIEEIEVGYGRALKPNYDERIYLASSAQLLDLVRQTSDSASSLLMIGHSPGLEKLALALTDPNQGGLRDLLDEKYPTGALAEIGLPAEQWRSAAQGSGTLVRFIRPRDLDPALGPEE
ncbi:MAG TPA: histidine phosphatase family protein [Allosphingosinicella sp.]|nr:histidine phosphatase family protein [Allosphingosinicella sp.]